MTFLKHSNLWRQFVSAAALLGLPGAAMAECGLILPCGVTRYSNIVYDLHMLVLGICVVIGAVVFGLMFYSIIAFRKSAGAKAAQWHESTKVEILWAIIPFLILIGMAVPATKALIMMENASNADMTIKVTGYQWKWHDQYLDDGINFFSTMASDSNMARQLHSGIDPERVPNYLLEVDNHLVVPAGKKSAF